MIKITKFYDADADFGGSLHLAPQSEQEQVDLPDVTDHEIKEAAEGYLNEYTQDFPPGNATCFAAGAKWMLAYIHGYTDATPAADTVNKTEGENK